MANYITTAQFKASAVADEADADSVYDLLVEGVSRLFDRECEVADSFFAAASGTESDRTYRANGTRYLKLFPYVADSITEIDVDGTDYYEAAIADRLYQEKEGYLIFDSEIAQDTLITINADWGFAAIPADIQVACLEQALFQWRKKDLSFADISGVPTAAVVAEFSPSFVATTKRYREQYSGRNYFA